MRVILLGANGQLGTDIRTAASREGGLDVVPVDRAAVDCSDLDAAGQFLRGRSFDCIINCTGYHKTDEVERNAQHAFIVNAHLVQQLAEICAAKNARLVQVSTDYVFGGQQKRSPLTESDSPAPLNVYGASKAMGEALALSSGADVLVVRVASLFGVAGSSGKGGNFVETIIRLGKENGFVRVVADQHMSPTSTLDAADAIVGLLTNGAERGIWHVVNSGGATWHEFAARIVRQAGISAEVVAVRSEAYATVAKRPPYSVLDNAKLASAGWTMRHWNEALDDYLVRKGHRSHGTSAK
jgi:dTDP-4-dehydrorhamnose reductase